MDVGESAFSGCISLEKFNCSGEIINIDEHAFSNCENLQKITLEGKAIDLRSHAFSSCKNLNEFSLFCKTLNLEDSVLYNSGNNKNIDLKIGADEIIRKNPSFFGGLKISGNRRQAMTITLMIPKKQRKVVTMVTTPGMICKGYFFQGLKTQIMIAVQAIRRKTLGGRKAGPENSRY